MPPHIQPRSLRDLSIVKVAGMVFHSCVAIEVSAKKQTAKKLMAFQEKTVSELQQFLLDNVPHIFDEICEVMCAIYAYRFSGNRSGKWRDFRNRSCRHRVKNARIFSSLMIHDHVKELKFGHEHSNSLHLTLVQIKKLKNIEELDIYEVILTDQVLVEIGRTCTNLKKTCISLKSKHASLESLNNLLKCIELEWVEIYFDGWQENQYNGYITKMITELPKIKILINHSSDESSAYLLNLTSVTSLQRLDLLFDEVKENDLTNILQMCPQAKRLSLKVPLSDADQQILLSVVAKSSLEIQSFEFFMMSMGQELGRLFELKGCNLTKLYLQDCDVTDITVNDMVYTIGRNCPQLEELNMHGSWKDEPVNAVSVPQTSNISTLLMFCKLITLELSTSTSTDLSLFLQVVLLHANKLKSLLVSVNVAMYNTGFQDILSQILNTNTLQNLVHLQLTSMLDLYGEYPPLPLSGIFMEHLLESCPKITRLILFLPLDEDAVSYIKELGIRIKSENFDLKLDTGT